MEVRYQKDDYPIYSTMSANIIYGKSPKSVLLSAHIENTIVIESRARHNFNELFYVDDNYEIKHNYNFIYSFGGPLITYECKVCSRYLVHIEIQNVRSYRAWRRKRKEFSCHFSRILSTPRLSRFHDPIRWSLKFLAVWIRCDRVFTNHFRILRRWPSAIVLDLSSLPSLSPPQHPRENPVPLFPSIDFIDHEPFPSFANTTVEYAPN